MAGQACFVVLLSQRVCCPFSMKQIRESEQDVITAAAAAAAAVDGCILID